MIYWPPHISFSVSIVRSILPIDRRRSKVHPKPTFEGHDRSPEISSIRPQPRRRWQPGQRAFIIHHQSEKHSCSGHGRPWPLQTLETGAFPTPIKWSSGRSIPTNSDCEHRNDLGIPSHRTKQHDTPTLFYHHHHRHQPSNNSAHGQRSPCPNNNSSMGRHYRWKTQLPGYREINLEWMTMGKNWSSWQNWNSTICGTNWCNRPGRNYYLIWWMAWSSELSFFLCVCVCVL